MANRRLSTADDIKLVSQDFKNSRWEAAASEILDFWDKGVRTYVEMGDRGDYSRTMYRNVFEQHFIAEYPDQPSVSVEDSGIDISDLPLTEEQFIELYQQLYQDIYRDGFRDGANWARDQ